MKIGISPNTMSYVYEWISEGNNTYNGYTGDIMYKNYDSSTDCSSKVSSSNSIPSPYGVCNTISKSTCSLNCAHTAIGGFPQYKQLIAEIT